MMLSMLKSWQCPEIQWVHYKQTPVITKGKSESSHFQHTSVDFKSGSPDRDRNINAL